MKYQILIAILSSFPPILVALIYLYFNLTFQTKEVLALVLYPFIVMFIAYIINKNGKY